jgi:hypothetical protein
MAALSIHRTTKVVTTVTDYPDHRQHGEAFATVVISVNGADTITLFVKPSDLDGVLRGLETHARESE